MNSRNGCFFKLALCYAALAFSLVNACKETCGRNFLLFFKRYTMCHLETQREICSMRRRFHLRRGFACGPCSQTQNDLPTEGNTQDIADYRETTALELKVSSTDSLTTLWLVTKRGKMIPVARSYLGNDWESYAGRFSGLRFQCQDSTTCAVNLPAQSRAFKVRNGKYKYQLATFKYAPSQTTQAARFLEKTTFGPTLAEINAFPESMAEWIQNQQNNIPLTSHRQMFREHWNHRFEMPSYQGISTHACGAGTRYRKYAFSDKDINRMVEIQTDSLGRKLFLMDGQARTVVNVTTLYADKPENNVVYEDGFHSLCRWTGNSIGSDFRLVHPVVGCKHVYNQDDEYLGVPPIFFDDDTPPTHATVSLDGHVVEVDTQYFEGDVAQEVFVETALEDDFCNEIPEVTGKPIFTVVGEYNGEFWLHDPRFHVHENTIASPKTDGGGAIVEATQNNTEKWLEAQCFSAPMNFLNEEGCYLSHDPNGCGEAIVDNTMINLTAVNFEKVYEATKGERYIYAVTGLRQANRTETPYNPPCAQGARSRWIRVVEDVCLSGTALGKNTVDAFQYMFGAQFDANKHMRDLYFPQLGFACDESDINLFDFAVMVEDECWQNVHRSHLQVYDFTDWVGSHPGGPDKIQQFATGAGGFILDFPSNHEMSRWYGNVEEHLEDLGRLGDEVSLQASPKVADAFASISVSNRIVGSTVVCGSPHEVANKLDEYGSLGRGAFDAATYRNSTSSAFERERQRGEIWMEIALKGRDQLRQKVAWVLSQILVVSPGAIGGWHATENFVTFYDIFVRHAFGNYRDILKEVSYSPLMAEMLSFLNSQSTAYQWMRRKRLEYADENYAREIMQLFSIGLNMLNNDGSLVLDKDGNPVLTYTNDDITEYARLWTGFQEQPHRGNIEERDIWGGNSVDPMKINFETRDNLPKMGLNGTYIGDGSPLCSDLPDKHFLKRGATYRLLGTLPKPKLINEPTQWATDDTVKRFRLPEDSALFEKLCNKGSSESCQYQAKVVLDEHLDCTGSECDISEPRVVEVEPGLYYEYTRMSCVQQAFFDNPQIMSRHWWQFYCANPKLDAGGVTCCTSQDQRWGSSTRDRFAGERVSLATAEERCSAEGFFLCKQPNWDCDGCDSNHGRWGSQPCQLKVKINLEGKVGIVHNVTDSRIEINRIQHSVREDTKTFFRVHWSSPIESALLSDYETNCAELGCTRDTYDNLCLCPVRVTESQVFSTSSLPSRDQVLKELHVGAFPPSAHDKKFMSLNLGSGVRMHSVDGRLTSETIFEVVDDFGVRQFRKNVKSVVELDTKKTSLSFRNPPHFISFTAPEARDAYYETEAGLDHYFYHPNTAPFLAMRFAQRFGVSNPSPRYVSTIATAFRTGIFVDLSTGTSFGKGDYGDMGAMVAAALLDREATSAVLDADPAHGSVLEPFLKIVRVMRSLGFVNDSDARFKTFQNDLQDRIGQQAHELPSVFSFFLPEYSPAGAVGDAELVCPECQATTGPKAIALMNGLFSLMKYGLDGAYDGFGLGRGGWEGHRRYGETNYATGQIGYQTQDKSSSQVIDELALLLTSGRLAQQKRAKLVKVYDELESELDTYSSGESPQSALINVQQLMLTTPEFHTNTLSDNSGSVLPEDEPTKPSGQGYKAVVYVMLDGGMDSFNLLVPHKCERKNKAGTLVDEQYRQERSDLAFTNAERTHIIDVDNQWNQPCSQFAVHPQMELLKELYDDGDLTFLANTGVMGESGMTKSDYRSKTKVQLFAHNAMQKESKTVDPWATAPGTGVLGRLATILTQKGLKTNSISIDNPSIAVEPEAGALAPVPMIVSRFGVTRYDRKPDSETFDMKTHTEELNAQGKAYSSIFGKTWSKKLARGIRQAEALKNHVESAELGDHWPTSEISRTTHGFSMISKLIQKRNSRGSERDFFYMNNGGWDHHSNLKENLQNKFIDLNQGLRYLVEELKHQKVWDETVVVATSEFARTININSGQGSDHAWGGHYFMMGGSIQGGKIVGQYPNDITDTGDLNLGRGRIIPTTSWDSVFNGIAQWAGADGDSDLDYCLPNRKKSTGNGSTDLMAKGELFRESRQNLRRR